jgi:membrane protein DedA with SNARE-associated domain
MISFSEAAKVAVDSLGMPGIALGVFLNGLGVPGISEALLPLAGLSVQQGHMNFWQLFVVAMAAQLLGVSCAYAIGRYGGVALVKRYGKYVLISSRELDAAQRAFDKRGSWLVVFGAVIPGIQGFLGYIAGIGQMNFGRFLVSAAVGKLVWIGGLIYLGMVLGDYIEVVDGAIKQIGMVVLAALIVMGIWYVRRHRKAKAGVAGTREERQQ